MLFISFSSSLSLIYSNISKPLSVSSEVNVCYNSEECFSKYYIDLSEYIEKNIVISIIFSSTEKLFSLKQIYYSVSESFDSEPTYLGGYNKTYDINGTYHYEYEFMVNPTINKKYFVFDIKQYDLDAPITVKLKSISEKKIILNSSNSSNSNNDSDFWDTEVGSVIGSIIFMLFVICCCSLKIYRLCLPRAQ